MIDKYKIFAADSGIDPVKISQVLAEAAQAAAEKTLPLFRGDLLVDNKLESGFDPVTEADKGAETAIREIIAAHFPDHGIIGEEWDTTNPESDFTWIIDPVDGTRAFIAGVPVWGTLIGFAHKGHIVAGSMSQPFVGEIFTGGPAGASYSRNGVSIPIHTSGRTELAEARLFTTAPELFDMSDTTAIWEGVRNACLQTRYGCDCYGYALVAAGHADLVVEPAMNIYDIAALIPIIEQAGGVVTTWDGGDAQKGGDIVAAATPELHQQALTLIANSP